MEDIANLVTKTDSYDEIYKQIAIDTLKKLIETLQVPSNELDNSLQVLLGGAVEATSELKKCSKDSSTLAPIKSTVDVTASISNTTLTTNNDTATAAVIDATTSAVSSVISSSNEEHIFARPKRAAKLRVENCLKEPSLHTKLRRPDSEVNIKLEHMERLSQRTVLTQALPMASSSKLSIAGSEKSDVSIAIVSRKTSIVEILSDDDENDEEKENRNKKQQQKEQNQETTAVSKLLSACRPFEIKIKKETSSLGIEESIASKDKTINATLASTDTIPKNDVTAVSTNKSNIVDTSTADVKQKKRGRTKQVVPNPIKVERISDAGTIVSSKKGKKRISKNRSNENEKSGEPQLANQQKQLDDASGSIYEDALDSFPSMQANVEVAGQEKSNEKTTLLNRAKNPNNIKNLDKIATAAAETTLANRPDQNTFIVEDANNKTPQNATFVMPTDTTFSMPTVANQSTTSTQLSMETAKDTSQPDPIVLVPQKPKANAPAATISASTVKTSAKATKMPTRTKELFNPLIQSPMKTKVRAFENVAHSNATAHQELIKSERSKRLAKETNSSSVTPIIGKMPIVAPALGRFLTPNMGTNSNATPKPLTAAANKKMVSSASKAQSIVKSTLGSGNNNRIKSVSRENSEDELRKLTEERRKLREQKHLMAAQQREAKERERAERIAKAYQEREEKRLKRQMEAEQKKRELEENQRKQRMEDEANAAELAKQKAAASKMERELLLKQQKANKMLPPPPKVVGKYNFDMLHEYDSTDDEDKVSYKRPAAPNWSRKHVRGPAIVQQQYAPASVIDSFFSVQPMTPDLRQIFPNIDERHLKRNSSAYWKTPPRYSQIPRP